MHNVLNFNSFERRLASEIPRRRDTRTIGSAKGWKKERKRAPS